MSVILDDERASGHGTTEMLQEEQVMRIRAEKEIENLKVRWTGREAVIYGLKLKVKFTMYCRLNDETSGKLYQRFSFVQWREFLLRGHSSIRSQSDWDAGLTWILKTKEIYMICRCRSVRDFDPTSCNKPLIFRIDKLQYRFCNLASSAIEPMASHRKLSVGGCIFLLKFFLKKKLNLTSI